MGDKTDETKQLSIVISGICVGKIRSFKHYREIAVVLNRVDPGKEAGDEYQPTQWPISDSIDELTTGIDSFLEHLSILSLSNKIVRHCESLPTMHELRVYRATQAEANRTAAPNPHHIKQATANDLAAKAHAKGIPDDVADWNTISEKGVPTKASIVIKTISDNQYYYFQWREGDCIKSEYIALVSPI